MSALAQLLLAESSRAIGIPTTLGSMTQTTAGVTSITLTTTANIIAGNFVVIAIICISNNSVTVSSVSDGTNTYVKATNTSATFEDAELWYIEPAAAVGAGATITVTFTGNDGGSQAGIHAAQVSGIVASPLDKTGGATGNSVNSLTASTGALTQANEIAFGVMGQTGSGLIYNGASGFTNVSFATTGSSVFTALDYKTVNSVGNVTYNPTWPAPAGVLTACALATFKGN